MKRSVYKILECDEDRCFRLCMDNKKCIKVPFLEIKMKKKIAEGVSF
jgi:hypothetical protein